MRVASHQRMAERYDLGASLGHDWGMGWFFDRAHRFLHMSGQVPLPPDLECDDRVTR